MHSYEFDNVTFRNIFLGELKVVIEFQEHGLYYDGNNGCYYSYNQAENKFEFHSQVYSTAETAQDEQVIVK